MWLDLLLSFYLWFLFLFVAVIILWLPLQIRISMNNLRKDNSVSLEMEIFILGRVKLFRWKKHFLVTENVFFLSEMLASIAERGRWWKELSTIRLRKILFLMYRFILALKWRQLDIYVKLGAGDAAWTGVLTGLLRYLSAMVSADLSKRFHLENRPRILVYPSFLQKETNFSLLMVFYTSGAVLIYHSTLLLWELFYRSQIQILRRLVKYGRSSYTGLNDNGHGKFKGNGRC